MQTSTELASQTKHQSSRSGRRNRRRAKDLSEPKLREIKGDFEHSRSTLEVAQNHLLPRSEAVDAILMRLNDEFRTVRSELADLRRDIGCAGSSRPFLVARRAA
jgi:hypothetical protein